MEQPTAKLQGYKSTFLNAQEAEIFRIMIPGI